jgi:hypothetical protein
VSLGASPSLGGLRVLIRWEDRTGKTDTAGKT